MRPQRATHDIDRGLICFEEVPDAIVPRLHLYRQHREAMRSSDALQNRGNRIDGDITSEANLKPLVLPRSTMLADLDRSQSSCGDHGQANGDDKESVH